MKTITLEGKAHPLCFKVVTEEMESLGLRGNPNIIEYPIGEWYVLPKREVKAGCGDYGGIWVAKDLSGARKLQDYMRREYGEDARIFLAAIDKVLYSNSYRVKTNGLILLEEIL